MGSIVLPSQAYTVKVAPHPAPFSVLKFRDHSALSELYRYEVDFTSPTAGIAMDQVHGRPGRFIIDPIDPNMAYLRKMFGENWEQFSDKPPTYTVHGIVTQFDEYETSADETRYQLVIEPRFADLARTVTSRLFRKQSVPEIIVATLQRYGFDMVVSSSDGEVVITARKGVTLGDGSGAYLKLAGRKIVLGSPAGQIELKGNLTVNDAAGGSFAFPRRTGAPLEDIQQRIKPGFSG